MVLCLCTIGDELKTFISQMLSGKFSIRTTVFTMPLLEQALQMLDMQPHMQKWWARKNATGKKKMDVQLSIDCAEVLCDLYISARKKGFLDCRGVVPATGHKSHMLQMVKDFSLLGVFMQHMLQAVFTVGQALEQNLMHLFIASQLLLG